MIRLKKKKKYPLLLQEKGFSFKKKHLKHVEKQFLYFRTFFKNKFISDKTVLNCKKNCIGK